MTRVLSTSGFLAAVRVASAFGLGAQGCDQSFYFDVPGPEVAPDGGAPALPSRCTAQSDCPFGSLHCDTKTGGCYECVLDSDCDGAALHCDAELHRCVECTGSRDCAPGLACDATTHRCLASCADEQDCPMSAPECDERRGVCVICDEDAECRGAGVRYCALDGSRCVECRSDLHCVSGMFCDPIEGKCVACRTSADCAVDRVCEPETRECLLAPESPR